MIARQPSVPNLIPAILFVSQSNPVAGSVSEARRGGSGRAAARRQGAARLAHLFGDLFWQMLQPMLTNRRDTPPGRSGVRQRKTALQAGISRSDRTRRLMCGLGYHDLLHLEIR